MTNLPSPAPTAESSAAAASPWALQRTLGPAFVVLLALFACFELTDIDLWLQDRWFDFSTGRWWVDAQAPGPRAVFYDGPKYGIILLGLTLLTLALGPARWRQRWGVERRRLWLAFLCLGLIPALIGQLKASTNVFCPYEIRRYGGDMPYVKVLEPRPSIAEVGRCGRCFPAGHASGGFALFGLAGLFATRRAQAWGVGLGLGVGWLMGGYQMLKGAHYLSHTVVTMLLAWIGFLLLQRLLRVRP